MPSQLTDYDSYSGAIQDLGRIIIELSQLDTPGYPLTEEIEEKLTTSSGIELDQNSEYWQSWIDIQNIAKKYTDNYATLRNLTALPVSTLHLGLRVDLPSSELPIALLRALYTFDGKLFIRASYRHPGTDSREIWLKGEREIFYEGTLPSDSPDPVAIGRKVASVELAYLANKTRSCAATVDYWQTSKQDGWYQQQQWADIRDVNRQTINDRIRDAEENI